MQNKKKKSGKTRKNLRIKHIGGTISSGKNINLMSAPPARTRTRSRSRPHSRPRSHSRPRKMYTRGQKLLLKRRRQKINSNNKRKTWSGIPPSRISSATTHFYNNK